jgi:2-amino-4-hydroxy-6-hydroxymethyldihydropteridine diphosphokinase
MSSVCTDDSACFAYIALGSNLGDSVQILREAIKALEQLSTEPLLQSSLWRTSPVDCPPDSSDFINAVVRIAPPSRESPESLLQKLQKIEREFGRRPKTVLNEARPLDLDIISFGGERRDSLELHLPHPRARLRRFVLAPLNEIAPDLVLPGLAHTISSLLLALPSGGENVYRIG